MRDSRNHGKNMIGRNKNWIGPSSWMEEFNKKHNPQFYEKIKKKKTQTKKTSSSNTTERHPVFKVQD